MAPSTIVPAALSNNLRPHRSPEQPHSIRLETLDASSPFRIIREISEIIILALELGTPVWENMIPAPRAPLDVQIDRAAAQHRMAMGPEGGKVYVRAVGTFQGGKERTLGVAVWQRPGVRYHPVQLDDLEEEEARAFEGYDMTFRDAFFGGFQSYRDKLMGDDIYWYLSIISVHPEYQKHRIGSQLLDHGLRHLVDGNAETGSSKRYPTLLEATPAGERLYTSRGFVKEDEYTLAEQYPGMEEMKFPLYRRPADA